MSEKSNLETSGWRAGRPVEDPEKMKRWGLITARPSEYLVHVRRGKVLSGSSGQGASCFKWPQDAVAIVPTSIQQLRFRADQVTLERVGVEVVGLAVYRIAEPLLAYRMLNFSFPERAQQKLEETLTAMFVGAVRRLVANLSVDDCLQKRKSALAEELQREIAPVVGGQGHPGDATDQGWGVVIDTIEIQEVRVLSEKIFAAMQSPFRTSLDQRAREARAQAEREIGAREEQFARERELARLESERVLRERRDQLAAAEAEAHTLAEVRRREREAIEAEAALAALRRQASLAAERAEQARAQATVDAELRRVSAEVRLVEGQHDAEVARLQAIAEQARAEAQARVLSAQNLPALAAALGQRIGEVRIQQISPESPFASITQALQSVVELAHHAARPPSR